MIAGTSVSVRPVAGARERRQFIELPYRLYAADSNWVPPLRIAEKELLDERKNPFFAHAQMERFLAWRGNQCVGRIAAIDNRRHNEVQRDNIAFFGFFEAEDAIAGSALLAAAEQWARDRGRDALRGPASPSMNDVCGMLVEGFDGPPLLMMPYNPTTYPTWVEQSGYAKAKDLYAWWFDIRTGVNERATRILERMRRRMDPFPTIRSMSKKDYERDATIVWKIFSAAWKHNWGFVAPTEAEFQHAAREMKMILDWDLALIMELEGEPVAFCITLPDINQVLRTMNGRLLPFGIFKLLRKKRIINQSRLLLLGVLPEHRHKGLELPLIARSIEVARDRGWIGGECSWTIEDNDSINKAIRLVGGEQYRRYRMYQKPLR